jgi:hypothetical protein
MPDKWWIVKDEDTAKLAITEITGSLRQRVVPFLDKLQTRSSILAVYESGAIYGWEIEANEARLIMLAEEGNIAAVNQLLMTYAERWLAKGASKRAQDFIREFKNHFLQEI